MNETATPAVDVREDSAGRRVYEANGVRYHSVTTILEAAYPRPHLAGWAASLVANAALDDYYEGMSRREAFQFLQRRPYRYMRSRADLGRAVPLPR